MWCEWPPVRLRVGTIITGAILTSNLARCRIYKENDMQWIRNLINRIRLEVRYRKKLKELRKRDPFIYK
jgi:hypothetical protein